MPSPGRALARTRSGAWTLRCAFCDRPFIGHTPRRRYCSVGCTNAAYRERQRRRAHVRCRCGAACISIRWYAVPEELRDAWGAPIACELCIADGLRRIR